MIHGLAFLLLELAAKSTAVLAAAFIAARFARRLSSEERHGLWALVLIGLLALPAMATFGPDVRLTQAPISSLTKFFTQSNAASEDTATARAGVDEYHSTSTSQPETQSGGDDHETAQSDHSNDRQSGASDALIARGSWSAIVLSSRSLVTLYAIIASVLLARIAIASLRIARSIRALPLITDEMVLALFHQLASSCRLRRNISLRYSSIGHTPWAWGLIRPTIVLPPQFALWTPEAQRDALVHELSHIVRLDCLTTLLGYISCALYWFQPLAWLAFRRMANESEHACDDRVLLAGGQPTVYASQLLGVARQIHQAHSPPSVFVSAMARRSAVTRRITSILDSSIRRKDMTKTKALCASAIVAAFVLPLAAVNAQQPTPRNGNNNQLEAALPANTNAVTSRDLEETVRTYLEQNDRPTAVKAIADQLSLEVDASANAHVNAWSVLYSLADACRFCSTSLSSNGVPPQSDSIPRSVVLDAFDIVERRADKSANGNPLVRLAAIASRTGNTQTMGLGTFYLLEGFQLGNLTDESKLAGVAFLREKGQLAEAKALAEQLRDDPASRLYQSKDINRLVSMLDQRINAENALSRRLLTTTATTPTDANMVPLVRVPPAYPDAALKEGKAGQVQLKFTITKRGRTDNIEVVQSSDSVFDTAAKQSVAKWLYAPRLVAGAPVETQGVETVIAFKLAP